MITANNDDLKAKSKGVRRFPVEVELANNADVLQAKTGRLAPDRVRRERVRAVVDSGATRLVIPEALALRLGLKLVGTVQVRYADQRTAQRSIARQIHLSYAGRDGVFSAIVEPARDSALLGAIVLEDFDLIVDCPNQRLLPRDPKQIIAEIE